MYEPGLREPRRHAALPSEPLPRRRTRGRGALVVVLVLALVAGVTGYAVYSHLVGNITRTTVKGLGVRPIGGTGINILLIGSDSRAGANSAYGKSTGERSDTTLLLHLAGDSKSATAVSIPRDSMVQIPACTREDDSIAPPVFDTFNAAFARGGPGCTLKTVEQLTQVRISHFVVVDFTGFKKMVDALGTVDVCVPQDVDDKDSGLSLTAGTHAVDGETALAYVRLRHGLGDGSDLGRIDRQQAFLSSVLQKATSTGVLANPAKLISFLNAATSSMVTDEDFSVRQMTSLANSVRGVGLDKISFVTVPHEAYPPDPNRIQWSPAAVGLWNALRTDESVEPSASPSAVKVAPSAVHVRVLNGTRTPGLARQVATDLRAQGFQVDFTGNAEAGTFATSVVRAGSAATDAGRTVAAAVLGAKTETGAKSGPVVDLVVGANYKGVRSVKVASAKPAITTRKADQNVCS